LRPYEVMFILPAEADEKLVTTAVDRITKAIGPTGGSVLNIDRWGRRRFAYEIDRQNEGYYVVVAFDAEPSVIAPLERSLVLADEIMRAKVTIRHPEKPGRRGETSTGSRRPTSRPAPEPQVSTPETGPETEPETQPETEAETAEAAPPEQVDTPEAQAEPQPEASTPEPQPDAEGASPETSDEATSPAPA
jgi:small subunit ribosomal protein S6